MKRFTCILLLLLAPVAFAQNATSIADVAAGRAALVAHNLPAAHTQFQAALTADPSNQTAAALLGIFGWFDITSDPASQAFLTNLGVATSGRNPYQWTASIAKDGHGNPVIPANYNFSTMAAFWQSTLVPASATARAKLALVTDPNFLITLTPAETKLPMPLNIDYGDALMARACLRATEFLTHLGLGQNSDVNLQALYQVAQGNMLTLQSVLANNPNFLTAGDPAERTAAQAALLDTITLYNQASVVIRARPAGVNRLFMLEPRQFAQEAQFRQLLAAVQQSLTLATPIDLNGKAMQLSPLFGATWSLRAQLPTFDAHGFDVTAIPDASLGGLISGFAKEHLASTISDPHHTLAELGWQWVSPLPQGSTLYRYLVLPDGHRLVVGNGGAVLTSADGTTWTANRLPGVGQFLDLAVNGSQIVGVTYDGTIYSSTDDGSTWQLVYQSGGKFFSVTYGGGQYLAVGDYGLTATSTDGVNWNQSNQTNYGFSHVIYTGSQYVAVGYDYSSNNALIATSMDGQNWTQRIENPLSGPSPNYTSVAQNGSGVLVAVSGSSGSNNLARSTDGGNTWTLATVAALNDVTFSNGSFVAVGFNSSTQTAVIGTSPDGATWTPVSTPEIIALTGVSTGAGATFAVGQGGVILSSTDNIHFSRALAQQTALPLPQNKPYLALKAIGGQLYVGGGTGAAGGAVIARSSDGQNFTATTITGTTYNNITDFLLQGSTYYAVGNSGTILTSPDGANWTQIISGNAGINTTSSLNAIAYLNGKFFAVGTGSKILSSPDGASNDWATTSLNIGGMQMNGIAYGNGTYIAVGGSNNPSSPFSYVVSSTDGSTWTQRFVPTSETLKGIVFHQLQGTFTAVGTGGAIVRSTDGVNWWGVGTGKIPTNLTSINVLNGEYYATQTNSNLNGSVVISQSAVAMSSDGENWVSVPLGAANGPNRIEYFGGQLYVAAANSSILRSEPIAALAAPAIQNLTPSSITADQGSTLTLAVAPAASTGNGILTYQWSSGSGPISGATGPDLVGNNLQSTDAGNYTVTVTNAGGSVSSTFTVNVSATPAAPVITSNPQSQTVSVGLNASLSVQATGTTPLSYQWQLNGTNLTDTGNISGSQTSTLNLTGLQAANGGTYTVVVSGAGSTTSLPAVLVVDSNPVYNFSNLAGQANSSGLINNTGTAARFNSPHGVALDPTGTILYIADSNNSVIRAVTLATRAVTTFASAVSNVNSLAVDSSGNLYATCSDQVVRKITSGGVVSVFAGASGQSGSTNASGTSARFSNPQGIAIDPAGANLYIADTGNACIRKIVIATPQTVTTFAGTPGGFSFANGTGTGARFNSPQGIAIDPTGINLYVADTNNACIRKIDISSAAVSTYAGQPDNYGSSDGPAASARFSNPLGVTTGAVGNVFVTDNNAHTIRRISPAGFVTTIGGQAYRSGYNDGLGASALFWGPAGITLDSSGNLYVAENNNQTIRKGTPLSSPAAPVIAQSPSDQTVNVGSTVFFNVIASGTTTLSYQWLKNGATLSGATTSSLSLPNVQTADAGSYSVLVTGGGSALSAPANLTVTIPPTIGTQPVAQSVTSGGSVTLSVSATDVGYLTYQWLHNGLAIAGATGTTFTIPAAQRSDAGNYSVLINGVNGAITSNAALVQVAPTSFPSNLAYDPSFNSSPLLTLSSRIFTAIPLAGGKWMVGGEFVQWNATPRTFLARLNADYSLDPTFTPPLINGFVYALAQAPDGSIYVGGEFTAVNGHLVPGLFKLNPSAALDLTWQAQDVPPNASVTALAVQSDGRPLVARASTTTYQTATTGTNVLRRLNPDGTLDGTFSVNLVTNGNRLNAVAVESGGSVTFAGTFASVNTISRNGIARVNSTGATLDTVFGGAAGTNNTVFSMTLLGNGNYLIGGAFTSVAGTNRNHAAIIDANGALDAFSPVGGFNGNVLGAGQMPDGSIVLAGTFSNFNGTSTDGLMRLTSTGAVSSYYSDGAQGSSFSTVAASRSLYVFPQADGSIALFGSFQAALAQQRIGLAVINSGGMLASSPAPLLFRAAYANSAFVLPNSQTAVFGGIDLAGTTGPLHQAVRLNDDGSLDPTFPAGSGFTDNGLSVFGIYRTVLQGDGKFLSIGDLSGYNGQSAYRLVRINADGSFDSSFNSGGGPSSVLTPILPLSGGRTLVYGIGTTNTFNGQPVGALVRLNADGSIDPSFNVGSGINAGSVSTAYEQPDGKLVLAGSFTSYQGTTVNGLMRLNSDGSLDGTFSAGLGVSSVNFITGLPNGELVLAGNFTNYNGTPVNHMVVVSSTGAWDNNFNADPELNASVGQVIVEEDGKFIVVGDFTGTPNPYAVRLNANGTLDSTFSLQGMTEGFGSGTRIAIGDDGSVYAYSGNPVSYNYGVPVAFARFRGAAAAPTVVTPPAAVAASLGGSATFSVQAGGTAPYTYQWRHNGTNIPGATYSVLNLANLAATDAGNYDVVVTNSVTSVTSTAATLSIAGASAPSVITQSTNATAIAGQNVSFSAGVSANPAPTYLWQESTDGGTTWTPLSDGGGFSGTHTATLVVGGVSSAQNNAQFQAVITNAVGSTMSTAATLTVTPLPAGDVIGYNFTTLAGLAPGSADGTGAAAQFNNDNGVAVDSAGNAYVADSSNHIIRKIAPGGVVTTFAGTAGQAGSVDGTGSAARFNFPVDVAVDSGGNVYVSDNANNNIRKITPAGVVSTLAGMAGQMGSADGTGAAARFNGPWGLTVDGSGNVFVADSTNNTIREISATGVVTTVAGVAGPGGDQDGPAASALFSSPWDVAVDGSGNLFVADSNNCTIREITSGGVVSTFAGTTGQPGNADGPGTTAQFEYPASLTFDNAGNLVVADGSSNLIRRISPTGVVSTVAGTADHNGSVDGPAASAVFFGPWGVAVDGSGNIWVADSANNTVRLISGGSVSTLAGSPGVIGSADGTGSAARFFNPRSTAVDYAGNLYVADTVNNTIRKITPAGVVTTLAGTAGVLGHADGTGAAAQFNTPWGVAVDATGNVYVADLVNHTIRKITPTGVVTTFAGSATQGGHLDGTGSSARFKFPREMAVDGAGNVYVTDNADQTIRKITPAGVVTTLAGSPGVAGSADGTGSAARFYNPRGITVDSLGNVYVTDTGNSTIREITPAGVVSTLAGMAGRLGTADGTGSAAQFNNPTSIVVDSAGNLFVTDATSDTIRRITPAGVVTTVAGFPGMSGIANGIGIAARFAGPNGLSLDGAGNLYLADTGNYTIRKGTPVAVVPVAITIPPASTSVNVGQNASFSVTVTGDAPFTYQWYLNGQPIGDATTSTLSVNNAQSGNAGSYTVAVSNGGGTVTSAAGVLTVNAAAATLTLNNSGSQAFAVDPVDHFLYAVQLGGGSSTLNVINTQTNTVVGSLTYSANYAASASASGLNVFVADQGGLVRIFGVTSAGMPSALRTDPAPYATGSAALATTYAVSKQGTDYLDINTISTYANLSTTHIGGSAGSVYSDANTNRYYADYSTGTQVVDATTGALIGTGLSGQVVAVDSSSAHNFVYMAAAPGSSTLAQLDGATNAQTASYTVVGDYVGAVAVDSATGDVFVALPDANQVIQLNDGLGYVGQYNVASPQALTVADGELFVQSAGNATLTIIGLSAPARTGQTLTFNALPDVLFSTTPISLTATSDSGLTVAFAVTSGPATVSGNQLTLTGTGSVTVQASQAGNGSYAPAVSVSRTFNVNPSFASWQQSMFNPGDLLTGPNDVYGQDHLTNLVKYVLGLNPKQNATSGLPVVSTSGSNWVFTFTTPTAVTTANDVAVTVQVSTDLQTWISLGAATKTNSAAGTDTWQATYPINSAATVFFRLQVQQ
ncbi:MAG: immunoglobulin domain-containing protein [Opitutales bacterium]